MRSDRQERNEKEIRNHSHDTRSQTHTPMSNRKKRKPKFGTRTHTKIKNVVKIWCVFLVPRSRLNDETKKSEMATHECVNDDEFEWRKQFATSEQKNREKKRLNFLHIFFSFRLSCS